MEQKIYEKGVSGDACNRGRSIVTLLDGQPQYKNQNCTKLTSVSLPRNEIVIGEGVS